MQLARGWLEAHGFVTDDVSARSSFDFEAMKGDQKLKIEVKGITNDSADAILMTHHEVNLHRVEKGRTGLIVVSSIRLKEANGRVAAEGGDIQAELNWDIDTWDAVPIAFKLMRRKIV